ncbi:MAG TPA: hypothetical protein VM238_19810 [Phycisphaerae bacterium]|nr:hypothetical protein [Phycisphaerae bacterium]
MTTLSDYRPYYEVLGRVERVRARIRSLGVLEGIFTLITVLCGMVMVLTLAQGYLRFGPVGRLILLTLGVATTIVAFWRCFVIPIRYDPNDKEVARFLELRLPQLGNSLINTILLAERADEWSGVLVERAIDEAATGARGVNLMAAVSERRAKRWGLAAGLALLLLASFVVLAFGRFSSAGLQILMPFSRVASVGAVRFLSITPGNVSWIKGEPLAIEAVISDPNGKRHEGTIEISGLADGRADRKPLALAAGTLNRFSCRVPQVLQPFTYRLTVGGTESPDFKVALKEPPLIEQIDVVYHWPEYTGLEPQRVDNNGGEIRCLIGTTVEMTVRVSAPVEASSLMFGSGQTLKCLPATDGRALSTRFTVLADDTYQIHLGGEVPNGAAVVYRVVALEDQPPVVQFTVPARDVVAGLGESVRMSLKGADRYGLGEVRLLAQADGQPEPAVVATWKKFANPKEALIDSCLRIDPARYRLGQTIMYWAEAFDRRTYQGGDTPKGPNQATTAKYKIILEDKKAAAEQKLDQLSRLYERLREILKSQEQARIAAGGLPQLKALAEARSGGFALQQAQRSIRDATLRVVKEVKFDTETLAIRETLAHLAANEMASAMTKAKAIADTKDASRLAVVPQLTDALTKDQDTVIAVLRRILDITGRLADAVKEEQNRLDPSDLPADTLDKLKVLRDRLKEFVDEQKKVIEASKELAKRPVDDYQETDQRELEKLEAIEDQWDKFLTEAIADFSKVPEVDASNPSLCKELIEVKTDVEMAADALSKKAADIAVPLEELGMEGAEEVVENLERWLPDTPDRDRWSQEDFTGDYEIPHAELPEQLEDLVGDLLEEEEDIFEEMEDVTSNAGDSIDKGAGWDAMDGPISSFAAKGVTGNRLPNTSEISGRSGEGRTGKSSGEFVEDTATGKGGRRTPTRLSPDAFSKGEVKDTSPEAPTGATGGGKISGSGSEGLEGPVPPEVQRRMGTLAGRQAQLRNKAEGVKAALQVRNYDSFSLTEAIDAMRKIQRDILAGRYRTALRRKDVVLDSLKGTKMLLSGEVRIRKDASVALPNEVQKDVLDALDKPMPRGYEEYLKRYYTRLSEGS